MSNTINYAQIYNQVLDEIFYISAKTAWMENTFPGLQWNNGREIKIPKLSAQGLGDMSGYKAPDGDLTLAYETKQLQYYRGRNFTIGRYDAEMTNMALTVGRAMSVFLKQQAIPEMDKLRIMNMALAAYNAGKVSYYAPAAATVLTNLLSDIALVQDAIGEDEQLYVQISTTVKNLLMNSTEVVKYLATRELALKGINLDIQTINGQYLLGTPSTYLKTIFNLYDGSTSGETAGGVVADPFAQNINWIVTSRRAVDAVARPRVDKVIDPDVNQDGEYWKIMFSIYHGVWGYDNKANGMRMSINSSAVSTLYVASADSSTASSTDITVSATNGGAAYVVPTGYSLYYKIHSSTAPTVTQGTAIDNTWTLMTDAAETIASTNGYKITVALVADTSLLPVAAGNTTIVIS